MKHIFKLALGSLFVLAACNSNPDGYTLKGDLRGEVENGTQVFLRKMGENNQPMEVDTATVENGKFSFSGKVGEPEMHFLFIDKIRGYTPFILEQGAIEISAQKDSLAMAKISGGDQNKAFSDYIEGSKAIGERAQSINADLQKAGMENNEASVASLRDEMTELQEEYKNYELDFIKDHPDALISVLLLEKAIGTQMVDPDKGKELFDGLSEGIKTNPAAKKLQDQFQAIAEQQAREKNTQIGAKAPDFSAKTPEGSELALSDALGKVTLVDFWAAWCKPCRAENPNVVKVYEKYHPKGLNIIGVSLDRTEDAWKKAIADDGLTWQHVSNVAYFDDPIAKLYNINSIPATFLLDENGVIIAKNLRGPALEEKISELLD